MDDTTLVKVLKALADPKRFRMVQEVAAAGELSCGQLGERFNLSQPTVSHHLRILTDAGLLHSRSEARHHLLTVNRALLDQLGGMLTGRFAAGDEPDGPGDAGTHPVDDSSTTK